MNKSLRSSIILLVTAFIWGIAFVAQSEGGDKIGAFTFNGIRFLIAAGALAIACIFTDKLKLSKPPKDKKELKRLIVAGILCGVALCAGSNLQQVAINMGTPVGKAGFLTACYILLVPVLGLFLHKKCGWNVWLGVGLAIVGLYLLCIDGEFILQPADLLLLACALGFSVQILIINHFDDVDSVRLSAIQFLVCGLITTVPMIATDIVPVGLGEWLSEFSSINVWIPLLYAAILSSCVAYTLQIVGQKGFNPTIASLIMSLESVFSVLAGWVLLGQALSLKELNGCILIFVAVILAQIPFDTLFKKKGEDQK